MRSHIALESRQVPVQLAAWAVALAAALMVSLPQPARAGQVTPPPVPANIAVPEGSKAFLVGHARGTQNYICLPSASSTSGVAYSLFTPQATLFEGDLEQIITHFFSPNPSENGVIRATWVDARDTSSIWAFVEPPTPSNPLGHSSNDPAFVAPGAVAWLLLTRAGVLDGPNGGNRLSQTTYVQRLNTHGGLAPTTNCASLADVGKKAFMPYTADYFFFKASGR